MISPFMTTLLSHKKFWSQLWLKVESYLYPLQHRIFKSNQEIYYWLLSYLIAYLNVILAFVCPTSLIRTLYNEITLSVKGIRKEATGISIMTEYLQWTITGSSFPALLFRTRHTKSKKSLESSGTPWSGHATYWIWVSGRSSFFYWDTTFSLK